MIASIAFRRRARIITFLIGLALLIPLVAPLPVGAWTRLGTGCRFDPSNDDDGLGIGYSSTNLNTARRDSTTVSAGYWNTKMDNFGLTNPHFTIVSYGSSTRDVRVEFSNSLPSTTGAVTTYWCGSSHYSQDPLFTWNNAATYYTNTARHREAIASHELGHTYGLNHNQTAGCDQSVAGILFSDAVAKSDACNWAGPAIDDAYGASVIHLGL